MQDATARSTTRQSLSAAWPGPGGIFACRGLRAHHKLTYCYLATRATENGCTLPALVVSSATEIANEIGENARTVERWVNELRTVGLVIPRERVVGGRTLFFVVAPDDALDANRVVHPDPQLEMFPAEEPATDEGEPPNLRSEMTAPPNLRPFLSADLTAEMTAPPNMTADLAEREDAPPVSQSQDGHGGGDLSRTHAGAHAPSNQTEHIPPSIDGGDDDFAKEVFPLEAIREKAHALCGLFWPKGRPPITDRRDHRLIYRVALLGLSKTHGRWVKRWVDETTENKPKNPFAMLQRLMHQYAPPGVDPARLLKSIDVPRWALADPREWQEAAE